MKNKKLNTFEFLLIVTNLLALFVWIFFNNNLLGWISWASYVLYMISLYLYSIGKWQTHVFNILSYLFYIYICFYYFYLGEIISTFITIIISLILIFVWKKNQESNDKSHVKSNKINKWEIFASFVVMTALFIVFYFIFKATSSNEIVINALIMAIFPLTYYFSYRINKLVFLFSFLSVLLYLILWTKTLISGEAVASIYIIGSVFSIIWLSYSLYNWTRLEKKE